LWCADAGVALRGVNLPLAWVGYEFVFFTTAKRISIDQL